MARRTETTVTRTVRTQGADAVKHNLHNIAAELAQVRDQARAEASHLDRIRSMLDVDHLNDLLREVETLEQRIEDLEGDSFAAREAADAKSAELEREQDRLAKLWDAYKVQEDELERLKRDYPLMEEKLFEREKTIDALRREITRLEPFSRYKDVAEKLEAENRKLANEADKLEGRLAKAERTVDAMQGELDSLRAIESDAHRVADLEAQLEEEQERLAKLYRVYEDLETEKKDIEAELADWQTWFNKMRPAFETTGQAPGSAPLHV